MAVSETEVCEYQKEKVAKMAAAHLAEQWIEYSMTFPDQDHWIKEALAQYLQYVAVDKIEPKWRIFEEFFTSVLQPELDPDVLNPAQKRLPLEWAAPSRRQNTNEPLYPIDETSQGMSHKNHRKTTYSPNTDRVTDPATISALFAHRNIEKGVCLFRMLQHILTETVFRNSLISFMDYSRGKTVTGDDLWNVMTAEATNTTVPGYQLLPPQMTFKVIVNEWIFNKDYPILKVVRKYDKAAISFLQSLDNQDGSNNFRRPAFRHMPISYTTGEEKEFSSTAPRLWLRNIKQTIVYNPVHLTNSTWLLVNPQRTDLYRVNYDDDNWRMLKRSMENGELPSTIRAQLLDDALFLGRRGFLNYEFALNFTLSLATTGEKEYVVWNTVLRHFDYVGNIIDSITDSKLDTYRELFKSYIKRLILPVFKSVNDYNMSTKKGSHDSLSDHSDLLLQTDIYKWACRVGVDHCVVRTRMELNEWKQKADPDQDNPIQPDARYATLCSAMYNGNVADFEFLFYRYMNTSITDPNKHVYLKSLYCYKNISHTISGILSDTLLNEYSLPHLYEVNNMWQALAESPIITTAPFDYLLTHWKSILKKFSEYTPILRNILEGATVNVCREDHLNAIYRLKDDAVGDLEYLKEVFVDVIKHVKFKVNWKYQELNTFLSWLTKVTPTDVAPTKV